MCNIVFPLPWSLECNEAWHWAMPLIGTERRDIYEYSSALTLENVKKNASTFDQPKNTIQTVRYKKSEI